MKDKIIYALIAIALIAVFTVPIKMWATTMNLETGVRVTCVEETGTCWKSVYRIPAAYGSDLDTYLRENPDAEPATREQISSY